VSTSTKARSRGSECTGAARVVGRLVDWRGRRRIVREFPIPRPNQAVYGAARLQRRRICERPLASRNFNVHVNATTQTQLIIEFGVSQSYNLG
jgi:hypothetical protein